MAEEIYRFGVFRLEAKAKNLRVNLGDVPLKILIYLVERAKQPVPRDVLIAECMRPGSKDNSLTKQIKVIREALGETARGIKYIATLEKQVTFVHDCTIVSDEDYGDQLDEGETGDRSVSESETAESSTPRGDTQPSINPPFLTPPIAGPTNDEDNNDGFEKPQVISADFSRSPRRLAWWEISILALLGLALASLLTVTKLAG
jgi:DNA-binding winged helix-turn-helix (wHTH) protein